MITLDFETDPIEGNPLINPPKPCGLAIWRDPANPEYITSWEEMTAVWRYSLDSGEDLLFHNAPFDLSVGCRWLGGDWPSWERVHDTVYLVYLANPHADSLSLKPSAEIYLDEPPEERDVLHEWILANIKGATPKTAGAYISLAPVELVRPYAIGDVVRTRRLFDHLHPHQPRQAYDRERRLMPIMVEATRRGIRVDIHALARDIPTYEQAFQDVTNGLISVLGCDASVNLDSGPSLAQALDNAGLITEWRYTPKGRRSTSMPNLIETIKDPGVLQLLGYRSALKTCLGTFMRPWFELAQADGRLHPNWNQTRTTHEGYGRGTRTGRLSSDSPNFQNVPNEFRVEAPPGLPPLPFMRKYCLPEEGHVWVKRDFSSQEIRILAHYEDGLLAQAYNDDPDLDPHEMGRQMIRDITDQLYDRKEVKITGFSIVYGSGVNGLSQQLHCDPVKAANIKGAYLKAFPAIKSLQYDVSRTGRIGECITTWGGRKYYREPSARDLSYKLLNYLIQGSAADQTKQVICDWDDSREADTLFLATVHDEINISAPEDVADQRMAHLKEMMNQDYFDVPMRSEGFRGVNWFDLEETDG